MTVLVCTCASAAAIVGTYDNGDPIFPGRDATITFTADGVQLLDGESILLNDVVLVKDQVDQTQNGVYQVTIQGDVGVQCVLTRFVGYNTPYQVNNSGVTGIVFGDTQGSSSWMLQNPIVTFGTSILVYVCASNQNGTALPWTGSNGVTTLKFFDMPTTANSTTGVLLQNATPLLHTFGGNIFLGLVGNFTCSGPGGNTIIGSNAADMLTTGAFNTFLGNQGFGGLSSGSGNIAISTGNIVTLDSITTGSFNFAVNGGVNYTGAESSNVLIINDGVLGESHKMRLGTYGTGNYQQDKCYVDPTLVSNNGRISKTRSVTAASDTMLATDEFLICNRAGAIALALMASPETGRKIYIKDDSGAAAANNITITPAAGNIDGAASLVINTNYGSYSLIYNGTQWNIF